MSSLDPPRPPQSIHTRTRRANRALRPAVLLVALCAFAASASLFVYVRGRAAATTYYSRGSSPVFLPELVTSWSTNRAGTGSSPSDFTSGDAFVIQNGHDMSVTSPLGWSVSGTGSKVEIESNGKLTANETITLSSDTTFQIDSGGTYFHNNNSPYATTIFQGTESFDPASTVELDNSDTTGPSGVTFGNLTVNFTTDPGGDVNSDGGLSTVNGDFTIANMQLREIALTANNDCTLTVDGNLSNHCGTLDPHIST